jgi:cyanophycinase
MLLEPALLFGIVLAGACRPVSEPGDSGGWESPPDSPAGESGLDTGDPTDTADTGDPEPAGGIGVVVLAGGGSEGDEGDGGAWSARLYGELLAGGDVTGDGRVRVAVLSTAEESDWLPRYFEWLGADEAFNLRVASAAEADSCHVAGRIPGVDAVFIKGGDQGEYYDLWNNTQLETALRSLALERGGGIGGTSAGAMSLAGHALAGGQDLVSLDVLEDACTPWLDDASDGGSGVHDDFLGIVDGALIDTHFTQRGRLGRLAGAMARALDEGAPPELLGIGLEQQTGLVLRDGEARVVGVGAVSFLQASEGSTLVRDCGHPLVFTELRLDRLTEGWVYDLATRSPLEPPADAWPVAWDGSAGSNAGDWAVYGDLPGNEERFAWVVERDPEPFALREGDDPPLLLEALGVLDAHGSEERAAAHEALFRAIVERPGTSGFLVAYGGMLDRSVERPAWVRFSDNDYVSSEPQAATIVVDSHGMDWASLAPQPSLYDKGDGSLHAGGASGLVVHVLADSVRTGLVYDVEARALAEL